MDKFNSCSYKPISGKQFRFLVVLFSIPATPNKQAGL
jgi:hypothetical protein